MAMRCPNRGEKNASVRWPRTAGWVAGLAVAVLSISLGNEPVNGAGGGGFRLGGGPRLGGGRGAFNGYRCGCGAFKGSGLGGYKGGIQRGLGSSRGAFHVRGPEAGSKPAGAGGSPKAPGPAPGSKPPAPSPKPPGPAGGSKPPDPKAATKGNIRRELGKSRGEFRVTSRTVGKGIIKDRHNLNASVKGYKAITFIRQHSGMATAAEKKQFGKDLRSQVHTEPRVLRKLPQFSKPVTIRMVGQQRPCPRCQGAIRKHVQKTGNTVEYTHREKDPRLDPKNPANKTYTVRTTWKKLPNGQVLRIRSRYNPVTGVRKETFHVHDGHHWKEVPPGQDPFS